MDKRKAWLNIESEFRENINTSVICPECNKGYLMVQDIAFDEYNLEKGGERIIKCPICKRYEAVLYKNLPLNWNTKN